MAVALGYAGLMMLLVPFPSLELPTAVGPSKIAKGAAVGWVGPCWVQCCVAQALACFARSADLFVVVLPGGEYGCTTCNDLDVSKGACSI